MTAKNSPYKTVIIVLSILIPVAVALLFRIKIPGYDLSFLPPLYATINGITAVLLFVAFKAIKNGNIILHQRIMKVCLGLSAAFLVMYVLYHVTSDSTPFGGSGWIRYAYYIILISHILLSIAVVPLVLFTFLFAIEGNFERHKRLAKFTFPVWLYVASTGVIVYLMISPYYH